MGTFVTVLRAASDAIFLPEEGFQFLIDEPAARARLRTRWRPAGHFNLPEQLWLEVSGDASDVDDAIRSHSAIARGAAGFVSYVANAAVAPLEVELCFETTPGVGTRAFRQVFVTEPSSLVPRGGRLLAVKHLKPCIDAYFARPAEARTQRALYHYGLALRSWQIGTESQCLSHLWIAAENLGHLFLTDAIAGRPRADYAKVIGLDVNRRSWEYELKASGVRDLVFEGDTACYQLARKASDGYEHGYMDLTEVQNRAVAAVDDAFRHVRSAIARRLQVDADTFSWLMGLAPLDVASTRKVMNGQLLGAVSDPDALGLANSEYPILKWSSSVQSFDRIDDRFEASFAESFTVQAAPGVQFRPLSFEAHGRPRGGHNVRIGESVIREGTDFDNLNEPSLLQLLEDSIRALTAGVETSLPTAADWHYLGLLSHGAAHAESVALLLRDHRVVEALHIAARLFEVSILAEAFGTQVPPPLFEVWRTSSEAAISEMNDQSLALNAHDVVSDSPVDGIGQAHWRPTPDWLQTESAAHDRLLSWRLWRLSDLLGWSSLAVNARFTDEPAPGFRTQEHDLNDQVEVAAFALEALLRLRLVVGELLHLDHPPEIDGIRHQVDNLFQSVLLARNKPDLAAADDQPSAD